jgi:hypothetical protein
MGRVGLEVGLVEGLKRLGCDGEGWCFFFGKLLLLIELLSVLRDKLGLLLVGKGLVGNVHVFVVNVVGRCRSGLRKVVREGLVVVVVKGWFCSRELCHWG